MGRPSNAMLAERARLVESQSAAAAETTIVALQPIRRFQPADIDAWFLARLNDRWPGYSEQVWRGKFAGFAATNDYLCVTNDRSVALMFAMRHMMTGLPVVMEVLVWSRDAKQGENGDWNVDPRGASGAPLMALYRHALAWAKQMGAARTIIGSCCDIKPSALREILGGHYLVDLK